MENILIVSKNERKKDIAKLFSPKSYVILHTETVREAKKMILDKTISLVIIDFPTEGGTVKDLLKDGVNTNPDMIILTPGNLYITLSALYSKYGLYVMQKSVQEREMQLLLRLLEVNRIKLGELAAKNARLQKRLEDEKMLSKAKCLLAKEKGMSEEEGHRTIEKMAMNKRIGLSEASKEIIRDLSREGEGKWT